MTVCALELEDLLRLMASDIDNDNMFIRVDKFYDADSMMYADGRPFPKAVYIGPVFEDR